MINGIDINKIVLSNKVYFGQNDFNILLGIKMLKNRPLCIFLLKRGVYVTDFDKNKCT